MRIWRSVQKKNSATMPMTVTANIIYPTLEYLVPTLTVIGPYSHFWRNGHKRVEWKHNQQLQRYEGEYLMIHTNDNRKLPEKSNTSTQMTVSDFDSMMEGVMEICDRNVPW
jgi:hypothetical protein